MALPPPKEIPEEVSRASLALVKAINESGPRCVGIVTVIVFDNATRIVPVIDTTVRSTVHEDPKIALLETAAIALCDAYETQKRTEPEAKN